MLTLRIRKVLTQSKPKLVVQALPERAILTGDRENAALGRATL
jgi:hypothetical protein